MLFCVSIIFKTKLPLLVIFNKDDMADSSKIVDWMQDYDKFLDALKSDHERYISSLSRSMALSLDEFYCDLDFSVVSSITHKGMQGVVGQFPKLRDEYFKLSVKN
jgi:NADH/NAD ratio-sensing transcriptional regulator Rex